MQLSSRRQPAYHRGPATLRLAPRPRQLRVHSSRPERSWDNEDELDHATSEEFKSVADPTRYQRLAQHLDLIWSVSKRKQRPEQCETCRGSGEVECSWCHGTGVMTIGDTLFCGPEGCKSCPVCKGLGQCKCERCRGTGRRASWLRDSGGYTAPSP